MTEQAERNKSAKHFLKFLKRVQSKEVLGNYIFIGRSKHKYTSRGYGWLDASGENDAYNLYHKYIKLAPTYYDKIYIFNVETEKLILEEDICQLCNGCFLCK